MALSIIPTTFFLKPEDVRLGQFTVSLDEPQQVNHYPSGLEAPSCRTAEFQFSGHEENGTQSAFRTAVASLVSANLLSNSESSIYISPGRGTTYILKNVDEWFNKAIDSDDTKRWIQARAVAGHSIYMIVRIQTLIDPRISVGSARMQQVEGGFSVPSGLSLTGGFLSPILQGEHQNTSSRRLEFTVTGEQLFAVSYCKVDFSWLKRLRNQAPQLTTRSRSWNCLNTAWRGVDEGVDEDEEDEGGSEEGFPDAIEVTIADDLDISDGNWITEQTINGCFGVRSTFGNGTTPF